MAWLNSESFIPFIVTSNETPEHLFVNVNSWLMFYSLFWSELWRTILKDRSVISSAIKFHWNYISQVPAWVCGLPTRMSDFMWRQRKLKKKGGTLVHRKISSVVLMDSLLSEKENWSYRLISCIVLASQWSCVQQVVWWLCPMVIAAPQIRICLMFLSSSLFKRPLCTP